MFPYDDSFALLIMQHDDQRSMDSAIPCLRSTIPCLVFGEIIRCSNYGGVYTRAIHAFYAELIRLRCRMHRGWDSYRLVPRYVGRRCGRYGLGCVLNMCYSLHSFDDKFGFRKILCGQKKVRTRSITCFMHCMRGWSCRRVWPLPWYFPLHYVL